MQKAMTALGIVGYLVLLAACSSPESRSGKVFEALQNGEMDSAQQLVEKGVDLSATDEEGRTLVEAAVEADNEEMVSYLLAEGQKKGQLFDQATLVDQALNQNSPKALRAILAQFKDDLDGSVPRRLRDTFESSTERDVLDTLIRFRGMWERSFDLPDSPALWFERSASSSTLADEGSDPPRYFKYGLENLLDSDPETAWVEGANDAGAGEWVELRFRANLAFDSVTVSPGYFKSDVWSKNNRVKTLLLTNEYGHEEILEFQDRMEPQIVHFDRILAGKTFRLTIREVYPGSEWDDTCIAEIGFALENVERTPSIAESRWAQRVQGGYDFLVPDDNSRYMLSFDPWETWSGVRSGMISLVLGSNTGASFAESAFRHEPGQSGPMIESVGSWNFAYASGTFTAQLALADSPLTITGYLLDPAQISVVVSYPGTSGSPVTREAVLPFVIERADALLYPEPATTVP